MKTMINFTTSSDDAGRYRTADELRAFYRRFGCDGLEVMYMEEDRRKLLFPDMVVGVHTRGIANWMELDRAFLLEHYRRDLEYAKKVNAEYVVFHVTQVSDEECLSYRFAHTDEQVIDAACSLINELLDDASYDFWFLMENLWWPGFTFLRPDMTTRLLDGVRYPKKGIMLDTGHLMNTNPALCTPQEALEYISCALDRSEGLLPMIKGIHLHQSLSGTYIRKYLENPARPEADPEKRFRQMFEHIFRIDQHRPLTVPGTAELVARIHPMYLTYEYITKDSAEHARYLEEGVLTFP